MEESITYLKNISISPKKLRFYLKEIKKMSPVEALEHLFYGRQKATKILYQALKSAISNAKLALKTTEDLLKFKVLTVEEGIKLKRYKAGGRGTARPILKRRSHIKIILVSNTNNKNQLTKKISKSETVDKK